MEDMKKAIAYYRYSSHRQGEQSIEGQAAEAQRWAKANNYTIVKEYIDRAMTGTNDDREQFQLMYKEMERLKPDVLILWKIDRMGRNKEEIAFNKYRAKKNGVKIVYVAESIPDSPEGVILESVLEGMAEYYSLQLSQNIRRGQQASAAKCQSIGGSYPLGYRVGADKRFEIDPADAAIVREIYQRYTAGESQSEIIRTLNARGLRTKKGTLFSDNSLRTVLRNEKYTGVYIYKDIRIEGGMPAIIDKETFAKAQLMLKKNKGSPGPRRERADYILSGKLFCGHCGSKMVGVCGTSKTKRKHYYYACGSTRGRKKKKLCNKKNVQKDMIESIVLQCTRELLHDQELLEFIADQTYEYYKKENSESAYTDALQANLRDVEKSLANIMRAIEAGIFNDTTRSRMEELEEQKKQIQASLERSKLREGLQLTRDHILFFLERFRDLDTENPDAQKQLINTFINAVFVYDDKITISYNYTADDSRTITLSEIDSEKFDFSASCSTTARSVEHLIIVRNIFALTKEIGR